MLLPSIFAILAFVVATFTALGHLLNKRNLHDSQADTALFFGTGLDWKAKSRWEHVAQLFNQNKKCVAKFAKSSQWRNAYR